MNDHPSDPAGTGASGSSPEETGARNAAIWQGLRSVLEALTPDEQAKSGGEMILGLLDIWGITIAELLGRGVLDGPSLRDDLLGMVPIAREQDTPARAAMIEIVANNIEAIVTALDAGRKYRHLPGADRERGDG